MFVVICMRSDCKNVYIGHDTQTMQCINVATILEAAGLAIMLKTNHYTETRCTVCTVKTVMTGRSKTQMLI